MSTHSVKAKRRHPDTEREHYEVAHVTFELSKKDHTFALIAGEALTARDRRPLFSGVNQSSEIKVPTSTGLISSERIGALVIWSSLVWRSELK